MMFFLLLSQLWTSTVPYCLWLSDNNIEVIELCDFLDSDSEEEDKKDKKEKKIRTDHQFLFFNYSNLTYNVYHLDKLFLLANHSKINIPPPKVFSSLS